MRTHEKSNDTRFIQQTQLCRKCNFSDAMLAEDLRLQVIYLLCYVRKNNLKQNARVASSDRIQKSCYAVEIQSILLYRSGTLHRIKRISCSLWSSCSFSFLSDFYRKKSKISLIFGKFFHCLNNSRLGCYIICDTICTVQILQNLRLKLLVQ